jgi:DNA-binding NarL/FixJ family response regulator
MGAERDGLSVLIVDDDAGVLASLTREVSRLGHDATPCPSVPSASKAARESAAPFDAAIIDVGLGTGPDGIELLAGIRQHLASLPALVMTGKCMLEADAIQRFTRLRPMPCFARKPDLLDDVREFLRNAPIAPLLEMPDAQDLARAVNDEADLTPRQRQVLALVARGDNTDEIARRLGVRRSSIETHLTHLRTKFSTSTVREIRNVILKRAQGSQDHDEATSSPRIRDARLVSPLF